MVQSVPLLIAAEQGMSYKDDMEVYRVMLQECLTKKIEANPSYGLRAFAKRLSVSPGALSEILSGKRGLSVKKAELIANRAGFEEDDIERFINSVRSTKAQYNRGKSPSSSTINREYVQLTLDTFKVISDWYHVTILNLARIPDAEASGRWIASKIGITASEANAAVERLERLGLLVTTMDGKKKRMKRTKAALATPTDTPSRHLRKFHRSMIEKALHALEEIPVDKRDITSAIMAIDPEKVPEAKEMIKNFKRTLGKKLSSNNPKEVYCLNVNFLPLSEVQS